LSRFATALSRKTNGSGSHKEAQNAQKKLAITALLFCVFCASSWQTISSGGDLGSVSRRHRQSPR
jgi:hypothetical protein